MKELDFDELDRAVSSLMKNADASTPPAPEEKVVTISSAPEAHSTPAVSVPQSTTSAQPAVGQAASAQPGRSSLANSTNRVSPATRRGGRFMDVVHPSSAMTSTPPRPVSREGVTITAPTATMAPSTVPEDVPAASPVSPISESEAPVPSWPDPIDFHKDVPATPSAEPSAATPETPASLSSVEHSDESDLLQSPFLSGAKVDKRPLGAFARTDSVVDEVSPAPEMPSETESTQPVTSSDTQLPEVPAPTVVPDELKSDIIAIESDDSTVEVEKTEVSATIQSDAQPAATTVRLGATSIKQQYQETPSSTPVEHAPIYDSEPYHQPLAHPAKKKSGWLIVFLILLLLALGAAAGAAIYFFVL